MSAYLKSGHKMKPGQRGFVFSLEATVCLLVAIGSSFFLLALPQKTDLNDAILFQLAQDAAEVCAKQQDYSANCAMNLIKWANPNLEAHSIQADSPCKQNEVKISRGYWKPDALCVSIRK